MTISVRSRNLDLIRSVKTNHNGLSHRLSSITNASYLSQMALGSREISNSLARAIEEKLGLSEKWMDRDNRKFFEMDTLDYEVCSRMLCLTKSTKSNLLDFLDSLNNSA